MADRSLMRPLRVVRRQLRAFNLSRRPSAGGCLPPYCRVLAVLCAWLEVRHGQVNVPHLGRLLSSASSDVFEGLVGPMSTLAYTSGSLMAKYAIRTRAI